MKFVEKARRLGIFIDGQSPSIKYKPKENNCFQDCDITYENMTVFRRAGKIFSPLLEKDDTENVMALNAVGFKIVSINEAPAICVGLSELLVYYVSPYLNIHNGIIQDIKEDIINKGKVREPEVVEKLIKDTADILNSLRYFKVSVLTSWVIELAKLLYECYLMVPDIFMDAVIQIGQLTYMYLPASIKMTNLYNPYKTEPKDLNGGKEVIELSINLQPRYTNSDAGKLKYEVNGVEKYITDGTGSSIILATMWLVCIFERFGLTDANTQYDFSESYDAMKTKCNKLLSVALANDFCGKAIKGIKLNKYIDNNNRDAVVYSNTFRIPSCYGDEHYELETEDGEAISTLRDVYEDFVCFSEAYEVDLKSFIGFNCPINMHYFPYSDMIGSSVTECIGMRWWNRDAEKKKEDDKLNELKQDDIVHKVAMQKLQNELDNLKKQYESEITSLKNCIEDKRNTISELREELEIFKSGTEYFYSDNSEISEEVEEVSQEEMVSFLKDFKILFVGGRNSLSEKMRDLELYNVTQVSSPTEVDKCGTTLNFDFMVLHTKFVAHNTIRTVQSKQDTRGILMYYNGTNVDMLIKSMYQFITNWLKG